MSLTPPKLDDHNWNSLVEEAKRRIASKCPDWTDFNPSDPGMMLVELMAWMTETVLYRLNRVPDLNYVKFLELVGLRLHPAQPARTWVFFQLPEKVEDELLKPVRKGMRVATRPQTGREPIVFTTRAELHLTGRRIIKTCSRYQPRGAGSAGEREETHQLTDKITWETDIFALPDADPPRGTAVPHYLYLGDPVLAELSQQTVLAVEVKVAEQGRSPGQLLLEWQVWDGKDWQGVVAVDDTTEGFSQNGKVIFKKLPVLMPRLKSQIAPALAGPVATPTAEKPTIYWLRARLVGSTFENPASVRLAGLQRQFSLEEENFAEVPGRAFCESPPLTLKTEHKVEIPPVVLPLQPIDLARDFYPFGPRPASPSAFYLESRLFEKAGALVQIRFDLRQAFRPAAEAKLHWEYPTFGNNWQLLGTSSSAGVTAQAHQFKDTTNAFSGGGVVEFRCPGGLMQTQIAGQPGWFIRARLEAANTKETAESAVIVKSVALRYSDMPRPWAHVLSENYSDFAQHASDAPFNPFWIDPVRDPAFYLCFQGHPMPERGPYNLFLDVVPQRIDMPGIPAAPAEEGSPPGVANGADSAPQEPDIKIPGAQMKWEYSAPGDWKRLNLRSDGTEGLIHEGIVAFDSPSDWQETKEFQTLGHWLRVRWEVGEFLRPPRVRRVLLNGVGVEQRVPDERVLGSSDGTANQTFSLEAEILDGPTIQVRESDKTTDHELKKLQEETKTEVQRDPTGCWVTWTEFRNFFGSGAGDRHFKVDLRTGTFVFGDGIHGKMPPAGRDNVRAQYSTTMGNSGNVGVQTITVLDQAPPGVQGVTNYHPADGGHDAETMDQVKVRGPWELKHRNRAVTAEDFERLARKASGQVALANCYEDRGEVYVVIVPKDFGEKPQPGRWLVRQVTKYLDERRLINTRLKVLGPIYELIDVEVDLVLDPLFVRQFEETSLKARKCLQDFVHPISGLNDGSGWPLGRTLHLSELYYLLEGEKFEGVDHVDAMRIARAGTGKWEENIGIGERSYPSFASIEIRQVFNS
jgi:hypothetical protein